MKPPDAGGQKVVQSMSDSQPKAVSQDIGLGQDEPDDGVHFDVCGLQQSGVPDGDAGHWL